MDEARLQRAPTEASQWLTEGRDWRGTYYSPLRKINEHNVKRLGFAWEYKTGTYRGLEATPIVVDGTLYTSGNWGIVYALDGARGRKLWTFNPNNDGQSGRNSCCDVVNRGVAVWKGRVYVGSTDGRLFALDARTGAVVWSVDTIVDHSQPYSVTMAPRITGEVVVLGNGGSDMGKRGVRGYVTAYDLDTGRERWRFYTVPSRDDLNPTPAQRAALSTWDPGSDPRGGTVWAGTAYDPRLHLVYLGTGNASPYQERGRNPSGAHGDDLYASSIVALDARTGALAWFYQTVPGDNWDFDAASPFVLADVRIRGRARKTIMQASKNGYFYVLDRVTGQLISGKPFTYVNWARGLDAHGRPILTDRSNYTRRPQLIYPSSAGGHAWSPMSYSLETRLMYIPVIDAPMIWVDLKGKPLAHIDGSFETAGVLPDKDYDPEALRPLYGSLPAYPADAIQGPRRILRNVLRAWDPVGQRMVWERETSRDYLVYDGGVLSTGGNLVFQGRADGSFSAYSADHGKVLKQLETGVGIMAAPMTYAIDGEQFVAVMEGYGGAALGPFAPGVAGARHVNQGRIVAFKLNGAPVPLPPQQTDSPLESLPPERSSASDIARGLNLYVAYCSRCHSFGVGPLPDLRRLPAATRGSFEDIVLHGTLAPMGMGRFDDVLGRSDVADLKSYLLDESWKLLNAAKRPPAP